MIIQLALYSEDVFSEAIPFFKEICVLEFTSGAVCAVGGSLEAVLPRLAMINAGTVAFPEVASGTVVTLVRTKWRVLPCRTQLAYRCRGCTEVT